MLGLSNLHADAAAECASMLAQCDHVGSTVNLQSRYKAEVARKRFSSLERCGLLMFETKRFVLLLDVYGCSKQGKYYFVAPNSVRLYQVGEG
jgi:hypothetical protein